MQHNTLANAIRALSMDAVQQANSGHPGMPMGMADIATVLWQEFLKHNPKNPNWFNRDRFIVSNGHGSMLLYALLHLSGYELSIDDLKNFRQLQSKTPGHPEYAETPGVETSTGPLGQGLANGVGMAIAEKILAAQFNQDKLMLVDHHTYVFAGDGCLMEGISHEACSLAGTLALGKLIVFWDDNNISIDGDTQGWFTDNIVERFNSYHWQVIPNVNGHDPKEISLAIKTARKETNKPTLICCKTQIGFGSPNKANSAAAHGSPLGKEEVALSRKQLSWEHAAFEIPDDIYQAWNACEQGNQHENNWHILLKDYQVKHADLAKEFSRRIAGSLPENFSEAFQALLSNIPNKAVATRKDTPQVLEKIAPIMPELLGGSADLSGSNLTMYSGSRILSPINPDANYIHYGVREFGMAAIMNGIALHQGFIPFGGTFLIFSSYCANAIRMSALMKQRVIYVLTHDSVGLGEDGPTHQPVEQLAMLRAIPNLSTWRPCDSAESFIAWQCALENTHTPTCLLMSRQNLPQQPRNNSQTENIARGGYILLDSENPEAILIATGSEVSLAVDAAKQLKEQGKAVRVVSMPCIDVFEQQDAEYKESVLPKNIQKRVAIEAANSDIWYKYIGLQGKLIDLKQFGLSAPGEQALEVLGFTVDAVLGLF